MKGGYAGKMLFVDLSKGKVETKELSEETAQRFVGTYGIGARVLYDMMKPGVHTLTIKTADKIAPEVTVPIQLAAVRRAPKTNPKVGRSPTAVRKTNSIAPPTRAKRKPIRPASPTKGKTEVKGKPKKEARTPAPRPAPPKTQQTPVKTTD